MSDQREFQALSERIERLVERVNATMEGESRNISLELLQSVMDLHGAALARMVEVLEGGGEAGRASLERLGRDPMLCGLLVLYGIHPVELAKRVAGAVESVRSQLRKRGGSAEILGVSEGTVRLRLQMTGHSCGSTVESLKQMVEQAIFEVAPEVVEITLEEQPVVTTAFLPLATLQPVKNQEQKYEESPA